MNEQHKHYSHDCGELWEDNHVRLNRLRSIIRHLSMTLHGVNWSYNLNDEMTLHLLAFFYYSARASSPLPVEKAREVEATALDDVKRLFEMLGAKFDTRRS